MLTVNQVVVFNKKTKKYYHAKDKKWLDHPPKNCINSVNKLYFDYDKKTENHQLPLFKNVDINDLEIIQRKFQIVATDEKRTDLNKIYKNRMIFKKYQKELGYALPDIIKTLYETNQIKKYKYIVKLFDKMDQKNVFRISSACLSSDTLKKIKTKLLNQGVKQDELKFKSPLVLIKNDEQLLTLKIVAAENIYHIESLDPIIDAWIKMNLLD